MNTPLVYQYQAPDFKQQLAPADPHKMITVEEIFSISILELSLNLPKPKRRETVMNTYLRKKNICLLRSAIYQSHYQHQGYFQPKDVVQLSMAYSTVYYLGLDKGGIRGAINYARSQDIKMGMVNIDKFVAALIENIK